MSVSLEPIWAWPLVLLLGLGLFVLVVWSYRAQADRLPSSRRRTIVLSLKLAAVLVLLLAMFRPAIQFAETTEATAQILLIADPSRSMNIADGPNGKTRWQAAREDFARLEPELSKLGPRVEIRKFEFSKGLQPFNAEAVEGDGEQSAIGQMLLDVLKETEQRRTLAVLLLTDGAHRALPPNDIDPLSAAQQVAEAQIPIYPVVYGASSLSEAAIDLAVEDLLVDPVVFENKLVPLKVRLRAAGAKGRKATLRVLVEDRKGFIPQQEHELLPVPATQNARPVWEATLPTDKESLPVELTFVPQQAGELKIAVEVIPADGELLTRNNRVETIITVRQGGVKIAYFDIPREEIKSLKMVNGADKLQLDWFRVWRGAFAKKTKIPEDVFERGKYDVYVIGDVPASVFGPANLEKLKTRLEEGASLLMTGGKENFGEGGYAHTPLADFLPVLLDPPSGLPGGSPQSQIMGKVRLVPTNAGLQQYVMQIDVPEKNRARWQSLPPLQEATRLEPKAAAGVWAVTEDDGKPLLVAMNVGKARVAAFGGDSTWLWFLQGHAEVHQRFWRQMLLWLAKKDADTDQAVWVNVEPRNFVPGANVDITYGSRTADGTPIDDAEYQVEVISPKQERFPLTGRKAATDQTADFASTQTAGDYWVRVIATRNGEPLGPAASTRFIVDPRDLELDQPSADPDLMRQIATITGGASLKSDELTEWTKGLSERKFGDLTQLRNVTLWDNWWALLIFVGLMTAEWTLRKRWGLV